MEDVIQEIDIIPRWARRTTYLRPVFKSDGTRNYFDDSFGKRRLLPLRYRLG